MGSGALDAHAEGVILDGHAAVVGDFEAGQFHVALIEDEYHVVAEAHVVVGRALAG